MAGIEEGELAFEEAMPWLPSHVLHEAIWETKECHGKNQQRLRSCPKLPLPPQPQQQTRPKSIPRPHPRTTRYPNNWAKDGSGMQAIFLDSGKQTCGTGVFLPRRAGTHFPSNKRPACSPVLLPARVVQALNLNVHEIGLQISRRQDTKNNSGSGDKNFVKNRNGKDASSHCCVVSQNETYSPEILLPKEWTY